MTGPSDLAAAQHAFAAGDVVRARQLALAIVRQSPGVLTAQAILANACNALGEFVQAVVALDALHIAFPSDAGIRQALAMACNNSGSLSFQDGDLDNAARLYQRAVSLDNTNTLAWKNLAACAAQLRQHALALDCWQHLQMLHPTDVGATIGRARALRAIARDGEANAALDELTPASLAPEHSLALALEFERIGEADRAARIVVDAALEQDLGACAQLAAMEKLCGNLVAARHHFLLLAEHLAHTGDTRARFRAERDAALVIGSIFAGRADIEFARNEYAKRLQQLIETWPPQRLAQIGAQLDDLKYAHFSLAYQGEDDRAIAMLYGDWLVACASELMPTAINSAPPRSMGRIGIVCARWTRGTLAAYFGSWINALRAAGVEIYLYTLSSHNDEVSRTLAAQADRAARLPMPLEAAALQLRDDALDLILYPEIGLDAACEVLAALRLAPRQWAAWGHPVTTGLATIDQYLSVAAMEPLQAQSDYREKLALLPGIGTAYARPGAALRDRARLGLSLDAPIYLLPHSPLKLHPDTDELVAGILQRDRRACIVFIADETPALTRAHRHRLENHLVSLGIESARRLLWLPRLSIDDFRTLIASADLVIDTPHFSGGATSLDALAQNTPVVTIEGRHMRGRQTAAMLRLLDLPQLICADADGAAACAVLLVHDVEVTRHIRQRLRERSPRLFAQQAPLQALRELVEAAEPWQR